MTECILTRMMIEQIEFAKMTDDRLGNDLHQQMMGKQDESRVAYWLEHFGNAISNEVEEFRDGLPWKSWRDNSSWKLTERRKYLMKELSDVQKFLCNQYLLLKMTPKEVEEVFFNKGQENINRQHNNY